MTNINLEVVLDRHKHWLDEDCEGWQEMRADLEGANLKGAYLKGANLKEVRNIPFIPMSCPDTGAFIGYKKAGGYIVKLEVMEDAKRSSASDRKCRCSKAKVLEIQNPDGSDSNIFEIKSDYDTSFVYKIGEIVKEPDFCDDRWQECAAGIHFFINREEAVRYGLR